jgi:hypothetical protein
MNEVTEVVIALLMLVNGEMKEARIQTGYAECIKGARVAKRGLKINSNIKYSCIKCEAILEENIDGSKSIKKLIIEFVLNANTIVIVVVNAINVVVTYVTIL